MALQELAVLAAEMGSTSGVLIGAGGNASYKTETKLYITPSGSILKDIKESDFLEIDRKVIDFAMESLTFTEAEIDKAFTSLLKASIGSENMTPSIDTAFHEVMPQKYVLHLHPTKVIALTSSKNGMEKCAELFPESLLIDSTAIGTTLAKEIKSKLSDKQTKIVFLKNHGMILASNELAEINSMLEEIISAIDKQLDAAGITSPSLSDFDKETVLQTAPILRSLLSNPERKTVISLPYSKLDSCAISPEHLIFAGDKVLNLDNTDNLAEAITEYTEQNGEQPAVIAIKDKVVFVCADSYAQAALKAEYFSDAVLVNTYSEAFGGLELLNSDAMKNIKAILVKKSVCSDNATLNGKIAIVTGGAQGFGYGITEGLVQRGATVAIADLNIQGAKDAADKLNETYGKNKVLALEVNIANEESVEKMMEELVMTCGGLDLFVANAGVLKAGSVKTFEKKDWDFVTNINYTGYYICTKYVSRVMALQNSAGGSWTDIVQINSKSGLEGSNRNAAYAGSKFGTIGLTQSFALELVSDKIKVNSVCPGNFFDGPLWSDPDRGLFVQYLNSNKVPGAESVEDVKKFYEAKVPMNRGCFPSDVVKAITYCVLQQYETGQAVPVSGGQVMLN